MLDSFRIPTVHKATRQTRQQIQPLVGLPQKQRTAIGTDRPPVKTGHNFPPTTIFKPEAGLGTLCHSKSRSPLSRKQLRLQMFMPETTAFAYPTREKCRLASPDDHTTGNGTVRILNPRVMRRPSRSTRRTNKHRATILVARLLPHAQGGIVRSRCH